LDIAGLRQRLLSACSLMPVYERPALPVVNQWPDCSWLNIPISIAIKLNTDMGWRHFFSDKTLTGADHSGAGA
jgi:multidrug efflux system outer membrane protein